MSEEKWTPGPWKVASTGDIGIDIDAPYYEALGVGVNEESPFCVIISRRHVASRLEANAHLIAAAPELYEALEWLETYAMVQVDRHPDAQDNKGWRNIIAALAKARGET